MLTATRLEGRFEATIGYTACHPFLSTRQNGQDITNIGSP